MSNSLKSLKRFCVDRPALKRQVKRLRYLAVRWLCWPSMAGASSGPTILGYHTVGEGDDDLSVSTETFRMQITWLRRHGYQIVTLRHWWAMAHANGAAPARCVVLTFDDGFQGTWRYAAPILAAEGLAATIFLVTDYLGRTNAYDRPLGVRELAMLSWDEVGELKRLGWDLQSHGRRHSPLVGLSRDALSEELAGSKAIIEQRMGEPVEFFCYPYGSFDVDAVEAVAPAGYTAAVTCRPGTLPHPSEADPYRLPRSLVDGVMTTADFAACFSPGYRWLSECSAWMRQQRGAHLACPFDEWEKLASRKVGDDGVA